MQIHRTSLSYRSEAIMPDLSRFDAFGPTVYVSRVSLPPRLWDTGRDTDNTVIYQSPIAPVSHVSHVSPANDDTGNDAVPATPCITCGAGLFWRLSVLSGGPGPWHCTGCVPPDPEAWIDAHAMPIQSK